MPDEKKDEKARHQREQAEEQNPKRPSDDERDLQGEGQAGTSEPVEGVGENQGGGIPGAIGGGQSGQGGG